MSSTLEERLKNNSSAFDGLLSLIPAKYYYDDDTQNQWKAKKQSKEEAKEAKRAKLDPSQSETNEKSASASEVLKQRAANAKPVVLPGVKARPEPVSESEEEEEDDDEDESNDDDSDDQNESSQEPTPKKSNGKQQNEKKQEKAPKSKQNNNREDEENDEEEDINIVFDDEGNEIELQKEQERQIQREQNLKEQKKSSTLTEEEKLKKQESVKALKDKLASKISALKEKRKGLGSKAAGAPSSREAILEERRKKAEARALQKKRKAEELDDDDDDEEGDSDEDSDAEEDDGMSADNVLYQNIRFNDDERTTSDLSKLRKQAKKKGPAKKDLKAHLKLLEAKKQKLSQLEDSKLKEQNEKDKWNSVIAQAEGEKLRNDERLLKKALKRKEAQKRRSEIQWKERKQTVEDSISAKQKRREENLQIRKDNKGIKRKSQAKQKRKFKGVVVPKRAGFEGRRSRK